MSTLTISMPGKPLRIGRLLVGLTLWVGGLCAVAVLLAGPAYRVEWLPLGAALQTVRWGATVAIGGAVVALVALLLLIAQRSPPQLRLWAASALVLNAVVAAPGPDRPHTDAKLTADIVSFTATNGVCRS